jgi:hypothetical protein
MADNTALVPAILNAKALCEITPTKAVPQTVHIRMMRIIFMNMGALVMI